MLAAVAAVMLIGACSSEPKPVYQTGPPAPKTLTDYDDSLEPSAAALSLVPATTNALTVTDFDQMRLVLGFGSLTSKSPAGDLARFWRLAPGTAGLSTGMLRPQQARLASDFGFSQDDVAWEARYTGDTNGWVMAFHRTVPMAAVQRAVRAGVGVLRGAVVHADKHLVSSAPLPEPDASLGAEPEIVALAGLEGVSTYLSRGCLPFDSVFGAGMHSKLAAAPQAELGQLDELDGFSVVLGRELATVRLGQDRADAFERMRIADVMPRTKPDFDRVLTRGIADPSTGRVGYTLADPAAAAKLTAARKLPFAVCAE
ncbi:MAG: hypothetical protein L0H31_01530 [Nocardioidaceae bacterium]|nr:hypothetical protein [Nocardioidaceae bacterium]